MQLRSAPPSIAASWALAVAVALAAAGCSMVSDPKACTQIGCSDGLMVRIDDAPAGLVRVELLPSGETGPRYVVECAAAQGCAGGAWFPGFTGDYAVVRVTTSEGTFSWEVRPTYSVTQPNGLDCPPICRNASVTVSMNW